MNNFEELWSFLKMFWIDLYIQISKIWNIIVYNTRYYMLRKPQMQVPRAGGGRAVLCTYFRP